MLQVPSEAASDEAIAEFVSIVARAHRSDIALAIDLAAAIATSGHQLRFGERVTADVASTGGPTSLSTLLSPLFLAAAGIVVPKLGVPGRPSGGIDCYAQLPGFRTQMDLGEIDQVISICSYAHFEATESLAPLDARMFKIRQKVGAQAVPSLVAASLVGKKIAVGVRNAAIDIRVARYGNFGSTWGEAEENALLLIEVGKQHGLRVVPVLSDMNVPYQPFIGRAESLLAIREVFNVTQLSQLRGHAELCKDLALLAAPDSIRDAVAGVSIQKAREVLGANIEAQMGKVEGFERVCDVTSSAHKHEVHALNSGFMTSDMASLRQHMVEWQHAAKTVNGQRYPDPMGVIMLKRPGEWVGRGETVATFRAPGASVDVVRDALTQVIGIPSNKYRNVGIESIHG